MKSVDSGLFYIIQEAEVNNHNIYMSTGRGTGSLVFGPIMESLGPRWAFRICSGLAATTLVFFFIMQKLLPPVKSLCDDSENLPSGGKQEKEKLQNGHTERDLGEKEKMFTKDYQGGKVITNGFTKQEKDLNHNECLSSV